MSTPSLIPTSMTIYRPGEPPVASEALMPAVPTYADLKSVVGRILDGGRLEHVGVLYERQRRDLFVDEGGVDKGLPRNEEATALYRAATLAREPHRDPETLPAIYGPAVLFLRNVWF